MTPATVSPYANGQSTMRALRSAANCTFVRPYISYVDLCPVDPTARRFEGKGRFGTVCVLPRIVRHLQYNRRVCLSVCYLQ